MKSFNAILPRLILYRALAMIAAGIITRGVGLAEFQRIWIIYSHAQAGLWPFVFYCSPRCR